MVVAAVADVAFAASRRLDRKPDLPNAALIGRKGKRRVSSLATSLICTINPFRINEQGFLKHVLSSYITATVVYDVMIVVWPPKILFGSQRYTFLDPEGLRFLPLRIN